MKIIILIGIFLALWLIWLIYPIVSASRASKQVMASARPFERHDENEGVQSMQILVMGDSTAVGAGASDPVYTTAGRLGAKYPAADIQNISKNGMRLAELSERVSTLPKPEGDKPTYDLMLIQIGANDVTHLTPMKDIRASVTLILNEASIRAKRVIILSSGNLGLSPVFHFPVSTYLSKRTRDVRDIYIEEVAKRSNASYVNLYKERKDDIFSTDIQKYYAADRFHPTSDGYGVWFEEIEKVIDR